jgi:hypothetical protein
VDQLRVTEQGNSRTTQAGRSIIHPSRFPAVTKVARADWKNEVIDKTLKAEN